MEAIRRVGFLFFVLVIGIFLGTLGLRLAFMIVTPLFFGLCHGMRSVIHVHVNNSKQDTFIVSSLNK